MNNEHGTVEAPMPGSWVQEHGGHVMACDGHQLLLFTAMHKNAHAPSYPGQDIVVCNFFAHTKNQPPFLLGYRAGTTLYDTKYCISNNQHTRVFSAQEYQLSVATQTDGDTLQTSPIFPLCTIVPVPSLFLTVPQCSSLHGLILVLSCLLLLVTQLHKHKPSCLPPLKCKYRAPY